MSKPTLLAVLAHPDDESFGMGGTLALYAARGVEVHLVCATRGEVGEVSPELLAGFASVAELRESELRCAAGHLGLKGVHFLDYRDSGMEGSADNKHPQALAAQPLGEVAAKIVHYIRQLQPQVVLTFDPIGGYRHPDHIAIHNATLRAFEQAANPDFASGSSPARPACPGRQARGQSRGVYAPQRLYFHTMPRGFIKLAVRLLRFFGKDPSHWGRNGDIDLASLAEVDFPTHARIDIRSVLEKKARASDCHSSQGGGQMRRGLSGKILRLFSGSETFMRAYPPVEKGEKVERDLFTSFDGGK